MATRKIIRVGPAARKQLLGSVVVPTPTPTPVPTPTPTPVPTPSITDALMYHVQPVSSIVGASGSVAIKLKPMAGNWASVAGPIAFAAKAFKSDGTTVTGASAGAFGAAPSIPAGTTTELSITYSPAVVGYHVLTPSIPQMLDFGYVCVAAFDVSAGTAGVAISQTTIQGYTVPDQSNWERDVWTGTPGGGWSGSLAQGWARMDIGLTLSGTTGAMKARVFDALSTGATTAVGSGVMLHDQVQVSGALPAGAQTFRFNLPAFGLRKLFLELSADGGTSWYRVPKVILVGHRIYPITRSTWCGVSWSWQVGYSPETADFLTMAGGWNLATAFTSGQINPNIASSSNWLAFDGARPAGSAPSSQTSPALMELSRLLSNAVGVPVGMGGVTDNGNGIPQHLDHTGTPVNAFDVFLPYMTNGLTKFRWAVCGIRDGVSSAVDGDLKHNYDLIATSFQARSGSPTLVLYPIGDGFRSTGAGTLLIDGFKRLGVAIRELEVVRKDVVNADSNYGGYDHGHPTLQSRIVYVRDWARAWLSRTDPAFGGFAGNPYGSPMGPTFAPGGGTRAAGSAILQVPILHRGGAAINAWRGQEVQTSNGVGVPITDTLVVTPASDIEMTTLVTVRLAGQYYGYGRKPVVKNWTFQPNAGVMIDTDPVQPVVIRNDLGKIFIKLNTVLVGGVTSILFKDGTTMPLTDNLAFSVTPNGDYIQNTVIPGNSSTLRVPDVNGTYFWFADDNLSLGLPYGHTMASEVDYYIAAPTPASAQFDNLAQPLSTITGGWLEVSSAAPAGGPPMSSFKLSLDGGTAQTPAWSLMRNDNSYEARIVAPLTNGSHTVSFHPNGGAPTSTRTFTTASAVTLLGVGGDAGWMGLSPPAVASYLESYSAHGRRMWKDAGGTQGVAGQFDTISAWDGDGPNGVANRLGVSHDQFNRPLPLPSLDLSAIAVQNTSYTLDPNAYDFRNRHVGVLFEGQRLLGPCTPLCSQATGDLTIVMAFKGEATSSANSPFLFYNTIGTLLYATYDGSGGNNWLRGTKFWSGAQLLGRSTLATTVSRYRASDGQLDVFSAIGDGTAAQTASITWGPEVIAPTQLGMSVYWGPNFYIGFFNSFFAGTLTTGDVGAAMTHLHNRFMV